MDDLIYLDFNATTPIDHEVATAMRPFLDEQFGNPSSMHRFGTEARKAVEAARARVAMLLGSKPEEIVFTSGGTESNNMAIKGMARANSNRGNHIITSAVEHPAVLEVCHYLSRNGFRITLLPVDRFGMVDPDDLKKAITPQTILVTIMHANNEVGTIQPVKDLALVCRSHGIPFHSDAAQSVGKIPVVVDEMGVDLLSVAGHKFYAPKGVGALYIRSGLAPEKLIHGADHEHNRRAGTENLLEIVGMGKACEIAQRDLPQVSAHLRTMRDRLYNGLTERLPDVRLNGHPEHRLPNTLSLGFSGLDINTLLSDLPEIAASAGAACHADGQTVSSVLQAMRVPEEYALGTVRLSVGKYTTAAEIDRAVEIISEKVMTLTTTRDVEYHEFQPDKEVRLTRYTHGLGCACKLRPQELEQVLKALPLPVDRNVLVDVQTNDDAAVYRISEDLAIVQTVDFFTPIVDDPYSFGAIAAANALSDVYAMGAEPRFALNIVGFPSKRLPLEVLGQILRGAQDKAMEAGVSILGGHSVEDTEPKFGMAVTGFIHPDRILTNASAKTGDALILTKPIGMGILTTALKREMVSREVEKKIIALMSELNLKAYRVMMNYPVNACTDVTGFGLLGHLKEMTEASGCDAEVVASAIPVVEETWDMIRLNMISGGTLSNADFVANMTDWDPTVGQETRMVLCDAQTSGGLLIALPEQFAVNLLKDMHSNGLKSAARIGSILHEGKGRIRVRS
ncbi:MAG: selenide, water dikinase SelD [Lentimicrobiaceae bacterium]|nr:selenide, water dikinase SelD [Lentimicrobiaceae bacterium]